MEAQSSLIIQTLPPILTSIGGFFILLFFGFGKEQKEKRLMAAALLVLLIWSVYICLTIAGEKITMFSPYITVISLILSMIIFLFVFFLNIRTNNRNNTLLLSIFTFGILLSTSGFVNYFGMKNRAVIAVNSGVCNGDLSLKKNIAGNFYNIKESKFFDEIGFVVNNNDTDEIKSISVGCTDKQQDNDYKLKAFKKSSRGLGVEYVYDRD